MQSQTFESWADALVQSVQNLWVQFIQFIPTLIGALGVFLIAWIVGIILAKVTVRVLAAIQADRVFDQIGVMKHLHAAGVQWEFSSFVAAVVKWFFIIAGFLAAVDILGLNQVSAYLGSILAYIPNIIVAALILLVAAILADFLERVVEASMRTTGVGPAQFLGLIVRWSVWGFAIFAALDQLGIADRVTETLAQAIAYGFAAFIAIAAGIAFGLGGQGHAREILDGIRKDVGQK